MAKSKALIAAEARIAELEAQLAGAQARIEIACEVYRNQKARIGNLEAALNTRGEKPGVSATPSTSATPSAKSNCAITPVVSRYTDRCGRLWEKTRVGTRAVARLVLSNQEHCA